MHADCPHSKPGETISGIFVIGENTHVDSAPPDLLITLRYLGTRSLVQSEEFPVQRNVGISLSCKKVPTYGTKASVKEIIRV